MGKVNGALLVVGGSVPFRFFLEMGIYVMHMFKMVFFCCVVYVVTKALT